MFDETPFLYAMLVWQKRATEAALKMPGIALIEGKDVVPDVKSDNEIQYDYCISNVSAIDKVRLLLKAIWYEQNNNAQG